MRKKIYVFVFVIFGSVLSLSNLTNANTVQEYGGRVRIDEKKKFMIQDCKPKVGYVCLLRGDEELPELPTISF